MSRENSKLNTLHGKIDNSTASNLGTYLRGRLLASQSQSISDHVPPEDVTWTQNNSLIIW